MSLRGGTVGGRCQHPRREPHRAPHPRDAAAGRPHARGGGRRRRGAGRPARGPLRGGGADRPGEGADGAGARSGAARAVAGEQPPAGRRGRARRRGPPPRGAGAHRSARPGAGYRDREGRWSERAVEPQLLVRAGAHEFLLACCRERQELRWFREDRIGAAEVTGEPAPRRDLSGVGAPPSAGHPAGRKLPRTPPPPAPPRLRVLRGGRA
ncbi:WYL domain-containing protein [Blastococcus sp. SYSU DS0533]